MSLTIYDCDCRWYGKPDFYHRFLELDFLIDMKDELRFRLLDTDYYVYLTFSSFLWVFYPISDVNPEILSLEDVLEKAPGYAAEKIVFHLELFKQEKRIGR